MARRLQLHEELCSILGSRNVYFQPPESVKLKYDAIVYSVSDRNDIKADDIKYGNRVGYDLTFITLDPDSNIPEKLLKSFSRIRHSRSFTSGNLHHDLFKLYY